MATFITSKMNKRKVCDEKNHIYEKNGVNSSKTKIYWRCERFYKGCRAAYFPSVGYPYTTSRNLPKKKKIRKAITQKLTIGYS